MVNADDEYEGPSDKEADSVEGIGNRYPFQPAEKSVDTADDPQAPNDYPDRDLWCNAEGLGDAEQLIDGNRSPIKSDRHATKNVGEEEHDGYDPPSGWAEAIFQELGDSGEAASQEGRQKIGAEIDQHRNNGRGPGDWREVALVDVTGHAGEVGGAEIGQHQRPGDHPAVEAVPSQEVSFGRVEIIASGVEVGDQSDQPGEEEKGKKCGHVGEGIVKSECGIVKDECSLLGRKQTLGRECKRDNVKLVLGGGVESSMRPEPYSILSGFQSLIR